MIFNFESINLKRIASLFILIIINLLFVYKYTERVVSFPGLVSILMLTFYVSIWFFKSKLKINKRVYYFTIIIFLSLFIVASLIMFIKIPVDRLNVDRWSMIQAYWDSFLRSEYVYYARSHMGNLPAPMPFYFILALPFYFLGELGLFSLLGIVVFAALVNQIKLNDNIKIWGMVFIMTSFFYLWEVLTRSNVFINSTLILFVIIWFNSINKQTISIHLLINAIIAGLLLSTRSVLVIPYIIGYIYQLKSKNITFNRLLVYGIVSGIAFSLTFLPFIVNHFSDFIHANPFVFQSTMLIPYQYTFAFIAFAFVAAFQCSNEKEVYFYSGLVLFVSIAIYFIYHAIKSGIQPSYLGSIIDISYFIFSTPFLIYYLLITEIKQ